MRLPGLYCLAVCCLFGACYHLDTVEETDEFGTVTRYSVDPETGLKEGTLTQHDNEGKLMLEEEYATGELQGERRLYYPDGKLEILEHYEAGQFSGEYRTYYPDGKLKQFGHFVDNEAVGKWLRYHPEGGIMEEVTFRANLENGPFREWYANGNPKASGAYKDGDNEHGVLHLYGEEGELQKVMDCEMRRCRTVWTPDSTGLAAKAVDMTQPDYPVTD